jgi:multiple sugar transport system ATP-binding protein
MTLGDTVAVLNHGVLLQVASPQELYRRPVNLFVAGFIGSPAMNMVETALARSDGGFSVKVGSETLALDAELLTKRPKIRAYEGRKVIVGIRPEHLQDAALVPDAPADRRLRGPVQLREALGSDIMVHLRIDAPPALTEDVLELAQDVDAAALHDLEEARDGTTMIGRFGAESRVREGETAEVFVDTRALHFFDPDTSLGIYGEEKKGGS